MLLFIEKITTAKQNNNNNKTTTTKNKQKTDRNKVQYIFCFVHKDKKLV